MKKDDWHQKPSTGFLVLLFFGHSHHQLKQILRSPSMPIPGTFKCLRGVQHDLGIPLSSMYFQKLLASQRLSRLKNRTSSYIITSNIYIALFNCEIWKMSEITLVYCLPSWICSAFKGLSSPFSIHTLTPKWHGRRYCASKPPGQSPKLARGKTSQWFGKGKKWLCWNMKPETLK